MNYVTEDINTVTNEVSGTVLSPKLGSEGSTGNTASMFKAPVKSASVPAVPAAPTNSPPLFPQEITDVITTQSGSVPSTPVVASLPSLSDSERAVVCGLVDKLKLCETCFGKTPVKQVTSQKGGTNSVV